MKYQIDNLKISPLEDDKLASIIKNKYQLNELTQAKLSLSEEEELKNESKFLSNFEDVSSTLFELKNNFLNDQTLSNLYESLNLMQKLSKYDEKYLEFKNTILPKDKKTVPKVKKEYKEILDNLEDGKSMDELLWITKKDKYELLEILINLENLGLIKQENGIGYKLI